MSKYYEEINQGRCPKCGKKVEICENDVTIDSNNLYYYFSCDCGFVGHEIYNLMYDRTIGDDATEEELNNGWTA